MDIPKCRNPECPKSQTKINRDEPGQFTTIRCQTCGSDQVISKREWKQKARHENRERRRDEQNQRELKLRRKPIIFS